jgi:hypothetical protein
MSIEITSWLRVFFAVRERAAELRGLCEWSAGTSERRAWPRTTGADAIAIVSVFDPAIRLRGLRYTSGIGRQWRACIDDLARCAPHEEVAANAALWSVLAAASTYLHAVGAPLPAPSAWHRLRIAAGLERDPATGKVRRVVPLTAA